MSENRSFVGPIPELGAPGTSVANSSCEMYRDRAKGDAIVAARRKTDFKKRQLEFLDSRTDK